MLGELPDRQHRAVDRERRDDRVDAGAVGEAGVDHRRRLVDAPADRGHDLVDHLAEPGVGAEALVGAVELAAALDVDRVAAVDHHLGDGRVGEEALDRTVAEHVVAELGDERVALARR